MNHVAVDLGASGGKILRGTIANGTLDLETVHRFENRPIERDERYVWDVDSLIRSIVEGLENVESAGETIDTLGVDTWGVDFGLYADGELLCDPYAYRDPTLESTLDDVLETVSKREIFEATGINHWNVTNTLWQYHYLWQEEPEIVEEADSMVMMPQVIAERLGADPSSELTIASTTQMLDPETGEWASDLLDRLDLPRELLPEISDIGSSIGTLRTDALSDVDSEAEILLPVSHDTGAAVAGLPLSGTDRTFLSTGTWFVSGIEVDEPILTDDAFEFGASNELGIDGSVRFLKNVTGFFLFEECRKIWADSDVDHSYDTLIREARSPERDGPLIDPDDDRFSIEGDMVEDVGAYCRETDQSVPGSAGEVTRSIFESLAVKTALTIERLESIAGTDSDVVYLGGGGVRNELFCQMLASALGRPVRTGPVESTAVGNVLSQAEATGRIASIEAGRDVVESSIDGSEFTPQDGTYWDSRRKDLVDLLDDDWA